MARRSPRSQGPELDLSDVDHRVGKPIGGGQLWDPCSSSDIRRWVMAMDYPNPLHWDQEFARESKFGGIVAPQSIAVALDYGHGAAPACVGHIPKSHLIFGGEEWWFYGCPVWPGDQLFQERRFHDHKVVETKFAGPTMFSRGDTTHTNQHGTLVARERSTAIRYLYDEAKKRGMFESQLSDVKRWTNTELIEIEKVRRDWLESNRMGVSPHFAKRSRSATRCRVVSSARTPSPASPRNTGPFSSSLTSTSSPAVLRWRWHVWSHAVRGVGPQAITGGCHLW